MAMGLISWLRVFLGQMQTHTCVGIMRMSTAKATNDDGPSCTYSMAIDPMILAGDEITPKMF